ncbi:MAG: tryptophan synthase subunit alpha [Candidatus Omnitrophica bacterium]|nr:tryptophan synthase subunit alpha [Candidatus Omnitrophota bacterium]
MNRIEQKFRVLRKNKKKAFIPFLTAGDPNLRSTEELVLSFEGAGADIVELGVPFSDPLADGPTIQASSERALKKGVNLKKIFVTVARIRLKSKIPIALMTYYNPVFRYGEEWFLRDAKKYGVDGIIIPDLPPEEATSLIRLAKKYDISTVFFLAPTTTRQRMKRIVKASTGFIYYVSITGVTGSKKHFATENAANIKTAKKLTQKPVCVGFGISTQAQVKDIAKIADGVIVGSAIVKRIEKNRGKRNLVKNVSRYVGALSRGID